MAQVDGVTRTDAPEALVVDMLEWLDAAPRSYDDVIERWRTSCPRLSVWEDAVAAGLVAARRERVGGLLIVVPTARGRARLASGATAEPR